MAKCDKTNSSQCSMNADEEDTAESTAAKKCFAASRTIKQSRLQHVCWALAHHHKIHRWKICYKIIKTIYKIRKEFTVPMRAFTPHSNRRSYSSHTQKRRLSHNHSGTIALPTAPQRVAGILFIRFSLRSHWLVFRFYAAIGEPIDADDDDGNDLRISMKHTVNPSNDQNPHLI